MLGKQLSCQLQHAPTRERSYGFASKQKYSALVSVDKISKGKAKGTWQLTKSRLLPSICNFIMAENISLS
jgi:hypothetical protein